jgi:hypothetical protein
VNTYCVNTPRGILIAATVRAPNTGKHWPGQPARPPTLRSGVAGEPEERQLGEEQLAGHQAARLPARRPPAAAVAEVVTAVAKPLVPAT